MAEPQLVAIWTNRGHSWVQHIKYVQGECLMNLLKAVVDVLTGGEVC